MKINLWLHSHFNLIEPLRLADTAGELKIFGTYHCRKYPEVLLADHFEIEPKFASDLDYANWALKFVERHRIRVFVVGRKMESIAAFEDGFNALGCTLISACSAATHKLLDNKVNCYDALAGTSIPLPVYRVANDEAQFINAVHEVSTGAEVVCFKPTVSIFGYGFRAIETPENAQRLNRVPRDLLTSLDAGRQYVCRSGAMEQQIVMEYLPGQETSVDCLARDGILLRAVVRRKNEDGSRVLSDDPALVDLAKEITRRFRLTHLFNIQFREKADGKPVLLEINTRMSGGTNMSCLSGLVLPYWGIKLALGKARVSDIPYPRYGARVAELRRAVILA